VFLFGKGEEKLVSLRIRGELVLVFSKGGKVEGKKGESEIRTHGTG
jgi:hypothetical protein